MTVAVSRQALEFFGSAGLGVALGLLYDLGRALRRQRRRLTAPVDVLFALVFFLSLWLLSVYVQELRLFHCLGIFLGGAVYFLTLSPLVVRLAQGGLRAMGWLLGKVLLPVKKSVFFLRKLAKKLFPSSGKWGTINLIPFSLARKTPAGKR